MNTRTWSTVLSVTALSATLLAPSITHAEVGGTVTKVAPISIQTDENDSAEQTTQTIIRDGKVETVDVTPTDEDLALDEALKNDVATATNDDTANKEESKADAKTTSSNNKKSDSGQSKGESDDMIHFTKTNDKIEVHGKSWSAKSVSDVYETLKEQGVNLNNLENGEYYIIDWGDTLQAISDATNVPVVKLAKDNGIRNIDKIYAGTKILIKK